MERTRRRWRRIDVHRTQRGAGSHVENVSTVAAAEPGREFAWVVGDNFVRWGYTLESVDGGTRLTEIWNFLPDGIAHFHRKFGDDAQKEIDTRSQAALDGIPRTLAAIKRIVEADS